MVRVKICGVRSVQDALLAAEAGADFVGLIFARARRQVSPATARQVVEALGGRQDQRSAAANRRSAAANQRSAAANRPAVVGVFVNEEPPAINALAEGCGLDYVQLSGSEPWLVCLEVERPVIKALHLSGLETAEELASLLNGAEAVAREKELILLLDAKAGGSPGGSGQAFDWSAANRLPPGWRFIVAGGLDPENVGEAVARAHPWGVDVSSGVETGGVKDAEKVRAFVRAAKEGAA